MVSLRCASRLLVVALVIATACRGTSTHPGMASADPPAVARGDVALPSTPPPVPTVGATAGSVGEWPIDGRNTALTRYSELNQITAANVAELQSAWSLSTGELHGHEGTPLVVGSTMYIVTPFPGVAYALDLAHSGQVKWEFRPNTDPWAVGVACCDVVTRGWAYGDGKLIYNLLDDRTIAIDGNTGREVWETKLDDVRKGVTMTMAPLVVKDKVIVGNSGGEMGVLGWIAALDIKTGKLLWRAYSTGPDSLVKIGPDFHPFYAKDRGQNLGVTTWPVDAWKHGAGAVWGWVSYDPAQNLIFYGTSNPGPWTQDQRPGDNKWTSTLFARDPDDGTAKWADQITPHDEHDYDAITESILVDFPINGQMRKLAVHFDRNGFAYTIDRTTGEILIAKPFAYENWAKDIDLKTGAPELNPDKNTMAGVTVRDICPPDVGGKDAEPAAFSPETKLFYIPAINLCMDYQAFKVSYIPGTPYWGVRMRRYPAPGGHRGELIAWDATTGTARWQVPEKFPLFGGALATGGNVVFYGTLDGYLKAVDATSGKPLWQAKVGSGIVGNPMTYLGPDGKQYVAVLSGVGGAANTQKGVPGFAPPGGTLYVYTLGATPASSGQTANASGTHRTSGAP
jgi:lanthanide-dependent methanol dehydrogenase